MRGMGSLNWLLPVSSVGFLLFGGFAIYGAIATDLPVWLLLAAALPAVPFVALGLIIALMDLTRRPKEQVSEEAKIIWMLVLAIFNVFAFFFYWLFVIRQLPPLSEDTGMADSSKIGGQRSSTSSEKPAEDAASDPS